MKYEITKIQPWPLARVTSLVTVAITVVISIPYLALMLLFSGAFGYFDFSVWMIAGVLGYIALAYVIGLVSGFVFAFVYNWIADYQKGIEIDIDLVEGQEKK
ncbi:hypothetical protein KKA01_00900 [Patescibacteria group bacterium]|nr:hypothetical protein [Patescibacteria group bacterium]